MRIVITAFVLFLANASFASSLSSPLSSECVIVLHGLARSASSMNLMASRLESEQFLVQNIGYPSRKFKIQKLAQIAVSTGLKRCEEARASKIHFVTHSLGGILVRQYLKGHSIQNLGRTVMLGAPNKGSEVVDKLKNVPGFKLINGLAGLQLGTDSDSIPLSLGHTEFEVGVIAGNRTINLFLSLLVPGKDDGKVSIKNTQLDNQADFIVLPVSHPFLMKNNKVIEQTIHFIKFGQFNHHVSNPK